MEPAALAVQVMSAEPGCRQFPGDRVGEITHVSSFASMDAAVCSMRSGSSGGMSSSIVLDTRIVRASSSILSAGAAGRGASSLAESRYGSVIFRTLAPTG